MKRQGVSKKKKQAPKQVLLPKIVTSTPQPRRKQAKQIPHKMQIRDPALNQKLIDAAAKHNFQEVKQLIQKGANVNYIRYTGSDAWYKGNTHSALYEAVHNKFSSQEDYLNVIDLLLQSGADPNFKAIRGGWNHANCYPLFSHCTQIIRKLKDEKQKLRFLQMFIKHGVNINEIQSNGRDKNFKSFETHTCFIFEMLNQYKIYSKISKLKEPNALQAVEKIKQAQQAQLRQKFFSENNMLQYKIAPDIQVQQAQIQKEQKKDDPPNPQLIIELVKLGVKPNSFQSSDRWQNYNIHMYEGEDQQYAKYETYYDTKFETILHRAIMNNLPQLVILLLDKGADPRIKCKYTSSKLLYPNQWPKQLKKIKQKHNLQNLQDWQRNIQQLKKQLKEKGSQLTQQKKDSYHKTLIDYEFYAYKAKVFYIQNAVPLVQYKNQQISCLELAEKFNACKEIVEAIKSKLKKQQELEHEYDEPKPIAKKAEVVKVMKKRK